MKDLEEIINDIGGHIGIYAENILSGTTIEINSEESFTAASVIKLPVLSALFSKYITGDFKPEQKISFSEEDLADDSPWFGSLGTKSGYVRLDKTAEAMVTVSDNTATNLLIDLLGFGFINNEIILRGMYNTSLKRKMCDFTAREKGLENITTPMDTAIFFQSLLRQAGGTVKYNEIMNYHAQDITDEKTASLQLIKVLTGLKDLEKIPSGINLKTHLVAGKPGELPGVRNDAALIISDKDENFIIGIFCEKVKDESCIDELIGKLTMHLLDYLRK